MSWNAWQKKDTSCIEFDGAVEYSLFHFSFIQSKQKSISAYLKNKVTCSTGGGGKDLRFLINTVNNGKHPRGRKTRHWKRSNKGRDGTEPLVIALEVSFVAFFSLWRRKIFISDV